MKNDLTTVNMLQNDSFSTTTGNSMSRTTSVWHTLTPHTVNNQRNPKSFTCNECGVLFSQESILTMHKLTHASDSEQYACEVCGKKFMHGSTLKHHTGKGTVCGSKLESKNIVKCDNKGKLSTIQLAKPRAVRRQSKKKDKGVKHLGINVPLCQTNEFVVKVLETKETDIFIKVEKDDSSTLANTEDEVMAKIRNKSKSSYTNPDAVDDERLPETVTLKSEITLGEYTFTTSSVNIPPPQLTKNEKQMPIKETNIKTYRCGKFKCGKIFTDIKKLCDHRRNHTEPVKCDICGKSLTRKASLKLHMLNHIGFSYSCEICGVKIAHKSNLKAHMAIHSNKFSCDKCEKSYRHRSSLDAHKAVHSGGSVNPYTCDECGRSLTSKLAFQRHIRSHSEKNFACELCDMKFSLNASLYYHKKKHDDGSLQFFNCSRCELKFTRKSKLRTHYRIHKGLMEKPFICGECGVSFTRKLGLTRHNMEKHTRRKTPNASDKESNCPIDDELRSTSFVKSQNNVSTTKSPLMDAEWTVPEITDIKLEIEVGEYECVPPSLDNITRNIALTHQHQQHLVYSEKTEEEIIFTVSELDHTETTIVKSENSSQDYDSIIS